MMCRPANARPSIVIQRGTRDARARRDRIPAIAPVVAVSGYLDALAILGILFGTSGAAALSLGKTSFSTKGKPVVRRGRKVTDQVESLMAELPKKGCPVAPGKLVVSPQGDHDVCESRAGRRQVHGARPPPERSPSERSPSAESGSGLGGHPGRFLDCSDHEYRRQPVDRSGLLSCLLRIVTVSLHGHRVLFGHVADVEPGAEPDCELATHRPRDGSSLLRHGQRRRHERQPERLLGRRERRGPKRVHGEPDGHRELRQREPNP